MKSNVQLQSWLTIPMDEVADQTPVADDQRAAARSEELRERGVRTVRGTYVDSSGVLRAKQVPVERLGAFNRSGLGASNSWAVFGADDLLCMTPRFSAVGDMRLRADLDVVVDVGDGVAWTPLSLVDQEGCAPRVLSADGVAAPDPHGARRGALRRRGDRGRVHGLRR